ncbi:MAG: nucleotidyltransferase domain-containing protein [Nanoarchaeota archaeon]|nr:nucleotidyltransferase domain-containing protein [Nanoarchaeota archaeon]MBU0977344.1 nucleotidyltransferase domain-containing protein [Nanoarchaeota archaeon]
MLQKYNRYKLLKVFLNNPTESFRLRELSRIAELAPISIQNYLKEFEKEKLIKSYVKRTIPFYQSQRENPDFIFYQKLSTLYELHSSGLIDYLWDETAPKAIILYGSHAKGEATENSDIDLFIIGKEKRPSLAKFQKILDKEIHLVFDPNPEKIPKELKNNLVNGIVLKGYFEAV